MLLPLPLIPLNWPTNCHRGIQVSLGHSPQVSNIRFHRCAPFQITIFFILWQNRNWLIHQSLLKDVELQLGPSTWKTKDEMTTIRPLKLKCLFSCLSCYFFTSRIHSSLPFNLIKLFDISDSKEPCSEELLQWWRKIKRNKEQWTKNKEANRRNHLHLQKL